MKDILDPAGKRLDLPRYPKKPNIIYVLATQPRSGSHFIAQLLRQTRTAGVPLEYFHSRHWQSWTERCRNDNPLFAFRMLCQLRTSSTGIFGVKAHWHQFVNAINKNLEKEFKFASFIYLCRNDLLKQAISHCIALQTGVWIVGQEATGEPVFSFNKIADSIKFILNERTHWERFFAYTGIVPYRLYYEDVCERTDEEMTKVCKYLGVSWNYQESKQTAIQRNELSSEWAARFHRLAHERYGTGYFWSQEFV